MPRHAPKVECSAEALWGLRGLRDQPRPGKPATYYAAFRNRVLALLEQPPPPGMSHWNGPAVAEKLGSSVYAIWRVQLVCEHGQKSLLPRPPKWWHCI